MAAQHQDLFTAAIPMAGRTTAGNSGKKSATCRICVVHSTDDRVVPIEPARKAVKELEANDATVKLIVVRGAEH